jgi:predicted nucleic acid-binding OB-fold protein
MIELRCKANKLLDERIFLRIHWLDVEDIEKYQNLIDTNQVALEQVLLDLIADKDEKFINYVAIELGHTFPYREH